MHPIGWDKLSRTTEEGGLGIRKSIDLNKALLIKRVWHIKEKPDSIWTSLCDAKYLNNAAANVFPNLPTPPHSTSTIWKSLSNISCFLQGKLFTIIGNGANTKLSANWIPNQPQNNQTHAAVNVMVVAIIEPISNTWRHDIIFNTFNSIIAQHIINIHLPSPSTPDTQIWPFSKNGQCTVKTDYQQLTHTPATHQTTITTPPSTAIYRTLWKLHTPPKVRLFLWKVIAEEISTFQLLHRFNIINTEIFPRCDTTIETIKHIFFQCQDSIHS